MENITFMTVSEVAAKLKVTAPSVRTLIKNELLPAQRIGKQWVVTHENLNSYIAKNNVIIEPYDHPRIGDDIPNITALSFFSGAMSLDIGMRNGGIDAILACEFNNYCRMTINENNPNIGLIGDITKYDTPNILKMANLPPKAHVDVIFGGSPCQAFSTAGNRKGFDDSRGNVFFLHLDIVGDIKPAYVVIENVRGLLSTKYPYKDILNPFEGGALLINH